MNSSPSTETAQIFDFDDYREFLKVRFQELKKMDRRYSFSFLANWVGTTDSYFKHVLAGRRNIGPDRITKVAEAFQLSKDETEYLTYMIFVQTFVDPILKTKFANLLSSIKFRDVWKQYYTKNQEGLIAKHSAVSKDWLRALIVELVRFPDFEPTAGWILARIVDNEKYTFEQVETALQAVLASGLVEKHEGKYRIVDNFIYTSAGPGYENDEWQVHQSINKKVFEDYMHQTSTYKPSIRSVGMAAIRAEDHKKIFDAFFVFNNTVNSLIENTQDADTLVSFSHTLFTAARNKV